MRVGAFSTLIAEGRERETGYVCLPPNQVYTIRLGNHHNRRADANVFIDGKDIGSFRINAGQTLVLETYPEADKGRFTFFKEGSEEASQANLAGVNPLDRGLIQVVFKVERYRPTVLANVIPTDLVHRSINTVGCFDSPKGISSALPQNATAGITGLTGQSQQTFYTVQAMEYDPMEETTISLRLICEDALPKIRELRPVIRKNAIPAPLSQ